MPKLKCSETGKEAEFWCVELKKAFAPGCLGRILTFDNPKSISYTIEKIDYEHMSTHEITTYILNTAVTAIIVLTFVSRGWTDNYFKGEPVCPSTGLGRTVFSHWDMNVFYYYKSSISTYCDIEDSFWRLVMDGWYRGIVTGSDSWLLLLVTLPQALIFKVTIVMLLEPVLGAIYGLVGLFIDRLVYFGITEAHVLKTWWHEHVGGAKKEVQEHGVYKKVLPVQNALFRIWSFMTFTTYHWAQTKRRLFLSTLSMMFDALYMAGLVRFVWAYFLGTYLPTLAWLVGICSLRELAFEIGAYYVLSFLCKRIDASLDKIFPKAGKPGAPAEPLTLRSDAYDLKIGRSYPAQWAYFKARMTRLYAAYRGDAGAVGATFETVFETVVGLRVIGILVMPYFNIAKVLRGLLTTMGFGSMLSRHSEWFALVTGFRETTGVYLSDSLADFGLAQLFSAGIQSLHVGKQVALGETYGVSEMTYHAWEAAWRALLPFVFYQLQKRWTAVNAGKEAKFAAKWKSVEGGDGTFIGWMKTHGCPLWAPVKEAEE